MNTIHVVCIGGSGLRVLRSFIYLLTAGFDIPNYKVKPYIVDPHLQSDDLKSTSALIARYQKVYNQSNDGFLKVSLDADINKLNVMSEGSTINKSYGDFIGYKTMDDNSRRLIDLLYTKGNIDNSMTVGFKGSPNVGCVVFQEFISSDWFKNSFSNLTNNDRIILIGSLFGGTGASGIPAIADALKQINPKLKIAAITLTPYFRLEKPDQNAEDKDIDSDIFNVKSLAALNFYNQNNCGIDSFYVVGDNYASGNIYSYDEKNQGNNAHFIELVAATAIKKFAQTDDTNLNKWNMFFTKNLSPVMEYDDCSDSLSDVLDCIANFYAFGKFFHLMQKDNFYPFYRRFYKAKSESSENDTADRIKTLRDIIYDEDGGDSFIKWLGELRDNNRSFQAVRTDDITSPQGQITTYGFSPKTDNPVFNGTEKLSKVNMSDYFLAINNVYRKTLKQKDQIDTVAKFLNICHKGIIEVNSK